MKEYLENLPIQIKDLVYRVAEVASKNNLRCYLVGGFVRDMLLGVENFDLDIVVEGDGIAFARHLADLFKVKVTAHKRFGTATLHLKSNLRIEVATARKDFYPQPEHLPVGERGS